jgi:hypothetical protein
MARKTAQIADHETKYTEAVAAHAKARAELEAIVSDRRLTPFENAARDFDEELAIADIAVREARNAESAAAAELNRTASDVEGLRDLLLNELELARDTFASIEGQAAPEASLTSASPDDVRAFVDAKLNAVQYRRATEETRASTIARLSAVFAAIAAAPALASKVRSDRGLPPCPAVVPGDYSVPTSALACGQAIAAVTAQREPVKPKHDPTLDIRQRELADFRAREQTRVFTADGTQLPVTASSDGDITTRLGLRSLSA